MTSTDFDTDAYAIWEAADMANLRATKSAAHGGDEFAAFEAFQTTYKTPEGKREILKAKFEFKKSAAAAGAGTVAIPTPISAPVAVQPVQQPLPPPPPPPQQQPQQQQQRSEHVMQPDEETLDRDLEPIPTEPAVVDADLAVASSLSPPPPTMRATTNAFTKMMTSGTEKPKLILVPTEEAGPETPDRVSASTVAKAKGKSKKATAAQKEVATAAAPVELEFTKEGLYNASLKPANGKKLTKAEIATYARTPERAAIVLGALVLQDMFDNKKKARFAVACELAAIAFIDGKTVSRTPPEFNDENLSTPALCKEALKRRFEQDKASILGDEKLKALYTKDGKRGEARMERVIINSLYEEFCTPMPFAAVAPFRFAGDDAVQFSLISSTTGEGEPPPHWELVLNTQLAQYFFTLNAARAFVRCAFGAQRDARTGTVLIDTYRLGLALVGDALKDAVDELCLPYYAGDSAGVYAWFVKHLPGACEGNGGELRAEHFALAEQADIRAKYKAGPQPKKRTAAAGGTKASKSGGAAHAATATTTTAAAKPFTDGMQTITSFAVTHQPLQTLADLAARLPPVLVVTLDDPVDKSPTAEFVRTKVRELELERTLHDESPYNTKEKMRALVAVAAESKLAAAVSQSAANKKNSATATAATEPNDEVSESAQPDASSRLLLLSYGTKLPKTSRHMLMGAELTLAERHAAPHGTLPATKLQATIRLNDAFAAAHEAARHIAKGTVTSGDDLLALVERLERGELDAYGDMLMAPLRLERALSAVSLMAHKQGKPTIPSVGVRKFFDDAKVQSFVARYIALQDVLREMFESYGGTKKAQKKAYDGARAFAPLCGDLMRGWL